MKISKDKLRIVSEVIFLILFILLLSGGGTHLPFRGGMSPLAQRWILVFGAGVLISVVFGRFYCAQICPMETLFRAINWLYKKLGIKRLTTPNFLKDKSIRYIILTGFLVAMLVIRRTGLQINLLAYIVAVSFLITLIFEDKFWHNTICPYGTILSVSSRPSIGSIKIDGEDCVACGKCADICPNESITTDSDGKYQIAKTNCLTCFKCQDACPVGVIKYKKV